MSTPTDPSAVNWVGDLSTLTRDQLVTRMESCATYAASCLRPKGGQRVNQAEADRALDLYAATREALWEAL